MEPQSVPLSEPAGECSSPLDSKGAVVNERPVDVQSRTPTKPQRDRVPTSPQPASVIESLHPPIHSNSSAAFSIYTADSICCGHTFKHCPQFTQADASPFPRVRNP